MLETVQTTEEIPAGPFIPGPPMAIFDAIYGNCREDSLIALGARRPGGRDPNLIAPRYLCLVPVKNRHEMLPVVFEHRIEDTQYVMHNTLDRRATEYTPDEHLASLRGGKPLYFRAMNRFVRELVAITIDLDVGRHPADIPAGLAVGMVLEMSRRGELPIPSLGALSGRGAYVMWLLRDQSDLRPPLNTPDTYAMWRLAVDALHGKTRNLHADANAKRLANWYKRPGTVDTRTGRTVIYMTFGADDLRSIPVYTLPALIDHLGIHHQPLDEPTEPDFVPFEPVRPTARAKPARPNARRRTVKKGKGSEPYRARKVEVEMLNQHRGGLAEGHRHMAVFHYANALRGYWRIMGHDARTVSRMTWDAACRLNATFRPPLGVGEIRNAVKRRRGYRTRNTTVAEALGVTEKEAQVLGLTSLLPRHMRDAVRAAEKEQKAQVRADREAKRAAVDTELAKGLSDAEIARGLADLGVSRKYAFDRRRRLGGGAKATRYGAPARRSGHDKEAA